MVLPTSRYNAAYFGDLVESLGIKDSAGYSRYLEIAQKNRSDTGLPEDVYNPRIKELYDKLTTVNLSNVDVLELGGAVGFYSEKGKELGVKSWTVLDLDIDTWCSRHQVSTVDNFISGDARTILPTMRKNEYEVIFSNQFLECIPEVDLPNLITEMNRVSKTQQIHVITEISNPLFYLERDLVWWSTKGFESGTILISHNTHQVLVI